MKEFCAVFVILILSMGFTSNDNTLKIALLKYNGGGDWYANETALVNLVSFCNNKLGTNISTEVPTIEAGSPEIFNYPYVHATGHGNIVFNDAEAKNLRSYLLAGGFLHFDDNYGMDPYVRPALKKVFPELELIELPFEHPIYNQTFRFKNGLPKIHEHDGKPSQGFGLIYEGRLVVFYSYESDLGDGWEDQEVHNDPEPVRQKALQMGANIIEYIFSY